jgi:hypothetical protein
LHLHYGDIMETLQIHRGLPICSAR